MDYSEKPKVSGNAVVVTLAVLLFGCIIAGALLFPRPDMPLCLVHSI